MLLKGLFLATLAAAAPAELGERAVDCKAVSLVAAALKIAPGASKYCSSALKISIATVTSTITTSVTVTNTATVTSTATTGVVSTQSETLTSTTTATVTSAACPAAQLAKRTTAAAQASTCGGAPIQNFACNLVSSACGCLSLPTPVCPSIPLKADH